MLKLTQIRALDRMRLMSRYYYHDAENHVVGPYSAEELRQLHLSGVVKPETLIVQEGQSVHSAFREFWKTYASNRSTPPPLSAAEHPNSVSSLAGKAVDDLRALKRHLLFPLNELRGMRWIENRRLLGILGVGLLPLLLIITLVNQGDVKSAYWAVALYFSALWAVYFYNVFPAPEANRSDSVLCFVASAIIGISVVLILQRIPPWSWLYDQTNERSFILNLIGYVGGVGLTEEVCKAIILFYLMRRNPAPSPNTLLFYGLMAGLGFGIREGINYQTGENLGLSKAGYYLSNLLRLTSLPFLHAVWTGMAGYFLGFAARYPARRHGLVVAAIGIPATLHGIYDTFTESWIGLATAGISAFALVLYTGKSSELEKALASPQDV